MRRSLVGLLLVLGLVGCDDAQKAAVEKTEQLKAQKSAATSSEAKQQLRLIVSGAELYFAAEHADPGGGLTVQTKVYPTAASWACTAGGEPGESASPNDTNWSKEPWKSLGFKISSDHRFSYCYLSSRDNKKFAATAELGDQLFCVTGNGTSGQSMISNVAELPLDQDCELP